MKYLIWIAIGALLWWAWRRSRANPRPAARPSPAPTQVQDMVACAHCGVHLPLGDALPGQRGRYCSPAHRQAAGDAPAMGS